MEALRTQALVIGALILRDMRTRFGRSHLSYVTALVMPLGHAVIVSLVWLFVNRPVPIGTSALIFFTTGVLPFVTWLYPFRQIAFAVLMNKPLLYFPKVKIVDIMLARTVLECLTAFVVVLVFLFFLVMAGEDVGARSPLKVVGALLAALYFGVAFGMFNGLIVAIYPSWAMFTGLIAPVVWAASGSVFMAETIPSPYREWLAINPLLHCVELGREGFYWDYHSPVANLPYVFGVSTLILALVLLTERQIRGRILQG